MTTETRPTTAEFSLKIGGSQVSPDFLRKILQVEVENNLHLPDSFTIRVHLSSIGEHPFDVVDDLMENYLSDGKEVEIAQHGGGEDSTVLVGEITSFGLDLSSLVPGTPPFAVIRGYDKSHRLHRNRHTSTHLQVSYSDVVTKVLREAGLRGDVDSTSEVHDYIVQYNETDWEFLWRLARRVGYEVYFEQGKLCFKEPRQERGEAIELEWGSTLQQFKVNASTVFQTSQVVVRGWDVKEKREIVGMATAGEGHPSIGDERSGSAQGESAFGEAKLTVVDRPVNSQGEADAIAQSLADAMAGDFIVAEGVTSRGMPRLLPGVTVTVNGIGSRFSGDYYVTATTHRFTSQEGYTTSFTVNGRGPGTLTSLMEPAAGSNQQAYCPGVVVGVVTDNNDPDDLHRVKVKLPWLDESVESDWAKMATPGAGLERGFFWLPEVEDEVLVAFEHGDVHRPYILGGLWNAVDAPPASNSEIVGSDGAVNLKGFRSREGQTFHISDESGNRYIGISNPDDDSKIVIRHDDKVIEILSNGDITITGAQGTITVEGNEIEIKASANAKIEAGGNLELTAGGEVIISGAQIKLN